MWLYVRVVRGGRRQVPWAQISTCAGMPSMSNICPAWSFISHDQMVKYHCSQSHCISLVMLQPPDARLVRWQKILGAPEAPLQRGPIALAPPARLPESLHTVTAKLLLQERGRVLNIARAVGAHLGMAVRASVLFSRVRKCHNYVEAGGPLFCPNSIQSGEKELTIHQYLYRS